MSRKKAAPRGRKEAAPTDDLTGRLKVALLGSRSAIPPSMTVASGHDGRGNIYVAHLALGDRTLYVTRLGEPTRRVALPDLLAAILDAEGPS